MGRMIAIGNQKGGVGKTTTTVNLGAALAFQGKKVLIIDMDSQGNATSGLGIERADVKQSVYEVLVDQIEAAGAILPTSRENLWILPSTLQLAGAEIELATADHRESRLKQAIEPIKADYDYILVDCPPSLGQLSLNAFTASDTILIPVQCEYYALEGLSQLLNTIRLVQRTYNKNFRIEGVLLTMLDARTNLGYEVVEEVRKYFQEKVYQTIITRNVRLSEAPSYGQSVIDYDPKSRGAEMYMDLAKEVAANG
ncbi:MULTISPECIES: ParA family protein [Abiotrophia]|jgi:sporulation initiation inhibitor protein Soj|uniref:Sporulation initiation inhibitor protein Soj n=2 Tax=Abiotrophia defectiva TaxID=46125 RepID=W1Q1E8_ABIDE|nr:MULTISPECIES: AAA family ATPase [Abiotrophia]MCO1465047.1 AAA family ATPase [Burkholderia multivorans]RKW17337.1 MAG: ParA family protein [Catonella sp.]ESK64811.1 sporulation initiation inhibitor protein Soj [Abiotrophia defectiva ATCC 49176]MBF0934167.1 ParA family protein [Abiotrophia defectiva]MBF0937645.1 ParA family protein [Abiotrophia sp.]